jgi:hypothetical protein
MSEGAAMARVRYVGNEPATVPELGSREVHPDEVVTVPDARYGGYVCQPQNWEAVEQPPNWVDPEVEEPQAVEPKAVAKKSAAKPQKTEG